MQIIDGRAVAEKIYSNLEKEVSKMNRKPKLVVVQLGDNEASNTYINQKKKAAERIGINFELIKKPADFSQEGLENLINELNNDPKVTGLIVQQPLPEQIQVQKIEALISPNKDVDGFGPNSRFKPATPLGIMRLLEEYKVSVKDKTIVIFGRGKLVGAPLKLMMEEAGAKVIQIHTQTPEPISVLSLQGDIVVAAVGKPNLVKADMVKDRAVVIDVGINRDSESGKLVGDVDFENVSKKSSLITPVPGGVGPMTVAMLMSNLVSAASNN